MTSLRKARFYLCVASVIAVALFASGCLWGVVTDAETGAPIPNAEVTYTDVNGNTGTTTTDAHGLYSFDQAAGPYPARGPVSFQVLAVGYHPMTIARMVEYNDNPGAKLPNLSSFWEVQSFQLASSAATINMVELRDVDISKVKSPPLVPGATATYRVFFKAWSDDDPVTPACEQSSGPITVMYPDPPIESLNYSCIVPGKGSVKATVAVVVTRIWSPAGGGLVAEDDTSTAEMDWLTPGTAWSGILVDSTDSAGPDDADLEFSAGIRYMSQKLIPLSE